MSYRDDIRYYRSFKQTHRNYRAEVDSLMHGTHYLQRMSKRMDDMRAKYGHAPRPKTIEGLQAESRLRTAICQAMAHHMVFCCRSKPERPLWRRAYLFLRKTFYSTSDPRP